MHVRNDVKPLIAIGLPKSNLTWATRQPSSTQHLRRFIVTNNDFPDFDSANILVSADKNYEDELDK